MMRVHCSCGAAFCTSNTYVPVQNRRGQNKEHMKFSPLGKFNYFHDHLKMPPNDIHARRKPHKTALAIVQELGSESNAHGLAKIAMSLQTKRKVMWSLLVIIGFTAAAIHLSFLVIKYLQYNVVEVSEMKDGMPVEFPSVTICNTQALSLTKLKQRMNENLDITNWINFIYQAKFGEHFSRVESIQGFYENLFQEAHIVGHEINDTLLHCRFNQRPCYPHNFTKYFDGKNYYNCYTFNSKIGEQGMQYMHTTGPQHGLSIVMALDNDDPPLGSYGLYNQESNVGHTAGLRVQVHAPETMPSPMDHGFDIPPGYSSSVGLKAVMNSRKAYPYGNCTYDRLKRNPKYRNTIFSCFQLCKQEIVIKECNCRTSGLPHTQSQSNLSYCGTFKNWQTLYTELTKTGTFNRTNLYNRKLDCEVKVLHRLSNDRSYEVGCQCFQPCQETSYQKSISLSYWPLEFYQYNALQNFYGILQDSTRINNSFMSEAYYNLHEIIKKYEPLAQNMTKENQQQMLYADIPMDERQRQARATQLIHQNLLRLNVYLEDLSVIEFKQMADYDIADLLSDIGGTLGLWMGISILTIMELVELAIRLLALLFKSENKYPDHHEDNGSANGILEQNNDRMIYPHETYDPYSQPEFQTFEKNDYGRTSNSEPPDSPV
ncbi:FMRFamide-activated amiloride-sensitive sodium channel-like isoform X1 [Saccostrea echinata]|uniref:FMRFamide-activated amiloride-sensitive sodium channel-like isoform X1 n=1 Tax=Saccostrea echinata TaxID=191078 RepID=UPI002A7EC724|nr:FMRFamide-activated amiloride-sensitive sodium channel-like isoform X1 [Saccostrea echinata]